MTDPHIDHAHAISATDRLLRWPIAVLVAAQAVVVGLQVVGRHVFRQPIPWTEEIATQQAWEAALGLDGQRAGTTEA